MLNQQNKAAEQPIQYLGDISQLITKNICQKLGPLNFKLLGSSNGVMLNKLFKFKVMVYVNALTEGTQLKFQLCIVDIQYSKQSNIVMRVPLVYTGQLSKIKLQKLDEILKVQIKMNQSAQLQSLIALNISILHRQDKLSQDSLSLLVLDPNNFQKGVPNTINLLKIKVGDSHILDYDWHPLSIATLMVLTSLQTLQIWNLGEEDFMKPTYSLRIKSFKDYLNSKEQVKIISFANLTKDSNPHLQNKNKSQQNKLNLNKFALFLMNSIGQILSVFPFLPMGSSISKQEYDIIYDLENHRNKEIASLQYYLNSCKTSLSEEQGIYLIQSTPVIQNYCKIQKWYSNEQIQTSKISKIMKQKQFYNLKIYPLSNECWLMVKVVRKIHAGINTICLSLINKQIKIDPNNDNVVYEIAEIRNEVVNNEDGVRFIDSDVKANQISLSKSKCLYFTQSNGLYKMDLSAIFSYVNTNSLKSVQAQDPIEVALIFQLGDGQNIAALTIEQSLNSINFVRRTQKMIKFQIQPLGFVNNFSEIQQIAKSSINLIKKLNSLKAPKANLSQPKDKQKVFQLTSQQINEQQERGVQSVKKQYGKYVQNIKNSIDAGLNRLKSSDEILKKRLKQFSNFKQKREQIVSLLQKVEENNKQINNILFQQKWINPELGQICCIEQRLDTLRGLFKTAHNKQLILTTEKEHMIKNQISQLLKKVDVLKQYQKQVQYLKLNANQN